MFIEEERDNQELEDLGYISFDRTSGYVTVDVSIETIDEIDKLIEWLVDVKKRKLNPNG